MKLDNMAMNASAVIEATRLLKDNPELARKLMRMKASTMSIPTHDIEMIEGIPTWDDAQAVADDFISEGAQINILSDDDGSYKVLADFGQTKKTG